MSSVWSMFIEVHDLFQEAWWSYWDKFEERKLKESRFKASKGFNIGILRKIKPKSSKDFRRKANKDFTSIHMKYKRFKID